MAAIAFIYQHWLNDKLPIGLYMNGMKVKKKNKLRNILAQPFDGEINGS